MKKKAQSKKQGMLRLVLVILLSAAIFLAVVFFKSTQSYKYSDIGTEIAAANVVGDQVEAVNIVPPEDISDKILPPVPVVVEATHIPEPEAVKALYITKWVAGSTKARTRIEGIADRTEINAVVIDIKDFSGRISFRVNDPELVKIGSAENDITNIRAIINEMHSKGIYVIGRVSTFQDPYLTGTHPEWAIIRKSDGTVWKDNKGLSFLDPANKDVWNYIVAIAKESYADGFDEINFDYIRYPSDGDIKNIDYKLTIDANGIKTTRADNLESFFKYLSSSLKTDVPGLKTSADLFGLVATSSDDLGIGQVLEKALPYFDYIAPMVYPSHFASGEYGIANPAGEPYEVISYAMNHAVTRTKAMNLDISKLRPWIQDFNLGAKYTTDMVKLEIKAVTDSGLSSFMVWDPNNRYHEDAFLQE